MAFPLSIPILAAIIGKGMQIGSSFAKDKGTRTGLNLGGMGISLLGGAFGGGGGGGLAGSEGLTSSFGGTSSFGTPEFFNDASGLSNSAFPSGFIGGGGGGGSLLSSLAGSNLLGGGGNSDSNPFLDFAKDVGVDAAKQLLLNTVTPQQQRQPVIAAGLAGGLGSLEERNRKRRQEAILRALLSRANF